MEYQFNDEKNKKILILLIFLIVIAIVIGGYIFYINNSQLLFMQRADKVLNKLVNSSLDNVTKYTDKDIVTESTFIINSETTENSENTKNEIAKGNMYLNLTNENEYKIFKMTINAMGKDVNCGIYEKEGIAYLELEGKVYKLNENSGDIKYDIQDMKTIQKLYNIIYSTLKKQLKDMEFYMLTDEKSNQSKLGVSLTDKRIKEIIIATTKELKNNSEFVKLYSEISELDKEEIIKNIEEFITDLDKKEFSEDNKTKIEIFVSGMLKEKTERVEITRTESGVVRLSINADIAENGANILINKENNTVNISFEKNKDNYEFSVKMGEYGVYGNIQGLNMQISLDLGEYKARLENTAENKEDGTIVEKGTIGITSSANQKIICEYTEKISFEGKEEKVILNNAKSFNEIFEDIRTFFNPPENVDFELNNIEENV